MRRLQGEASIPGAVTQRQSLLTDCVPDVRVNK